MTNRHASQPMQPLTRRDVSAVTEGSTGLRRAPVADFAGISLTGCIVVLCLMAFPLAAKPTAPAWHVKKENSIDTYLASLGKLGELEKPDGLILPVCATTGKLPAAIYSEQLGLTHEVDFSFDVSGVDKLCLVASSYLEVRDFVFTREDGTTARLHRGFFAQGGFRKFPGDLAQIRPDNKPVTLVLKKQFVKVSGTLTKNCQGPVFLYFSQDQPVTDFTDMLAKRAQLRLLSTPLNPTLKSAADDQYIQHEYRRLTQALPVGLTPTSGSYQTIADNYVDSLLSSYAAGMDKTSIAGLKSLAGSIMSAARLHALPIKALPYAEAARCITEAKQAASKIPAFNTAPIIALFEQQVRALDTTREDYFVSLYTASKAVHASMKEVPKIQAIPDLIRHTIEMVEKTTPVPQADKTAFAELNEQLQLALADPVRMVEVYEKLVALRRKIIFSHPALAFDDLLYNRRHAGLPGHMIDHYLAKAHRPGTGLMILRNWKTAPKDEYITRDKLPRGAYFHPDLSFDAKKLVFSFAPDVSASEEIEAFHIYEINIDGTGLRQLTGPGTTTDPMQTRGGRRTQVIEDWDPCYLPGGDIVFTSSRLNGHIRCAYGCRYNPTFGLHKMAEDGSGLRQLTYGDVAEYDPVVMPDGKLVYTRWDYVDRHDTFFQGLWRINPDGTQTGHVYGNSSRAPCVVTQAKPIPGSRQLMALAAPHHGQFLGSVIRIDTDKGEDDLEPITRLTPDVGFPEAGAGSRSGRYATPWPITEDLFLVAYKEGNHQLALYLADRFGGRELIHRVAAESCYSPIPLQARTEPPSRPDVMVETREKETGIYYISNVNESRHDIRGAGEVKYIRVNQIYDQAAQIAPGPSRVMNAMPVKILGELPVGADGSVSFEAPTKEMLSLQLLDKDRKTIMGMRTFIYLQPGEVSACVGCHENRTSAPPSPRFSKVKVQKLVPPANTDYPGGFSFPRSVQPILDKHCISCHGLTDKPAKGLDLVARPAQIKASRNYGAPGMKTIWAPQSYFNLTRYAKIAEVNKQTFISAPKDYYAHQSTLLPILAQHRELKLSEDELTTLIRWLDLNCICYGDWSWNRKSFRSFDATGWIALQAEITRQFGQEIAAQPYDALINRASLKDSRMLQRGLPVAAGGWGQTEKLWAGVDDPDYRKMLQAVQGAIQKLNYSDVNGTCGRGARNGCICASCWVRETYSGDKEVLKISNPTRPIRPGMNNHQALPKTPLR